MSSVDLSKVRFKPAELVEACRSVLEADGAAVAPAGMLATGPVADAVRATVGAYRDLVAGILDGREPELAGFVRGALPDVDARTVREAVAAIRVSDETAADEADGGSCPRVRRAVGQSS